MESSLDFRWDDEQSHFLVNPRLGSDEQSRLIALAQQFAQAGHIWIASSGSSKVEGDSLKFIALSKRAFLASSQAVNDHLQSTSQDIWLQVLPRFHVGGLAIESRAFLSGASVISGLAGKKWDPIVFMQKISDFRGSLTSLVPTQIFDLLQIKARPPGHLRAVVVGGSALSLELYQQAVSLGWPLLPSYGLTECCSQVATAELGSWSLQRRDLKILSHVNLTLSPENRLVISSPALLTGFAQWSGGRAIWKDPKVQGAYLTEDLCQIEGSYLRHLGRDLDFVKVSGEGVSLSRLQEVIESLAQKIMPAAWHEVAILDQQQGRQGVELILVHSSDVSQVSLRELFEAFNSQVSPYERLAGLRQIEKIPRTELGKIARGSLRSS